MSRVLLVCPEPLAHGQPAGVGIRFLEMKRVLQADGHSVTLVVAPFTPEDLLRSSAAADVAVVQGHAANAFFAHARQIPAVVDLYDPFIIENLHYYPNRGAEAFTHDHNTLVKSLLSGDLFLCASQAQRQFYMGMLLALGRVNPAVFESDPELQSLIRIAPFGVPPPRERTQPSEPRVLFGGIYDWYDPILAIDAIALARQSLPSISLTFTKHPNPHLTPQGKTAEAMAYVRRKGYESFIRFDPWIAYEKRSEFFDRFAIALLTFRKSLETELSMRTRVYDYLWSGLPVVSSSAPETDVILRSFECGVVVESQSSREFADALAQAMASRLKMISGARRFVEENQWPKALGTLRDFCRKPQIDINKETFAVQLQVREQPPSILERLRRRIGGLIRQLVKLWCDPY